MRHFSFLGRDRARQVFELAPEPFDARADRETVGTALGAVMYSPATRETIASELMSARFGGLTTMVLCLEDAIGDRELPAAEGNLVEQLAQLDGALAEGSVAEQDLPMLFVRVRSPQHLTALGRSLGPLAGLLAGAVLPKFTSANGPAFLEALGDVGASLWAMPVLESPELMYREVRHEELQRVAELLREHRECVPCVRVGATDMSGIYGLRRSPDMTIYDIGVVRDCIADIVNVLGRPEHGWTVAGPVWEYFNSEERILKPQLREGTFESEIGSRGLQLRQQLLASYLDGLVREVLLDQANGLLGKTVIHPSHVVAVNALSAVRHEEFSDAQTVLSRSEDGLGASGSVAGNKMNEPKPHLKWAEKVVRRGRLFGVLREDHTYVALLAASRAAVFDRVAA